MTWYPDGMETNAAPTALLHEFNPWIGVETDVDGSRPRLTEIDFSDSYIETSVKDDGTYPKDVDGVLEGEASAFLDSLVPQIKEAIFLIASGATLVVDRRVSADGRWLEGCACTADSRHIENDGGPCEACGEDY